MIFFVAGFAYAAWAPLVLYAKARLGVGDAGLGLLLLCLGAGSLVTMPLTATLVTRFGCRAVVYAAVIVSCLTLSLLTIAPTMPTMAAALFVFGAAVGTLDVSISIQAVIVEKASGRALMSGFHGLFSVGGIVGASLVSALLGFKFAPLMAAGTIAAINAALLLVSGPYLLARAAHDGQPRFVFPHGFVLFIGALCFAAFLAEGAMLDWSALFLVTQRSAAPALGGLGYAAFAATMTLGRLTGAVVDRRACGFRARGARRVEHSSRVLHRAWAAECSATERCRRGNYHTRLSGYFVRACVHRICRAGEQSFRRVAIRGCDAGGRCRMRSAGHTMNGYSAW